MIQIQYDTGVARYTTYYRYVLPGSNTVYTVTHNNSKRYNTVKLNWLPGVLIPWFIYFMKCVHVMRNAILTTPSRLLLASSYQTSHEGSSLQLLQSVPHPLFSQLIKQYITGFADHFVF